MEKIREVIKENRVLTVTVGEDMPFGVLLAVVKENGKNKTMIATNVIKKGIAPVVMKAVGIVNKSSTEEWGGIFEFNPTAVLRKDDYIEILTHGIITAPEVPAKAKLGDEVWLGTGGKLIFTAPEEVEATSGLNGVLVQKVGIVRNVERQMVEITL